MVGLLAHCTWRERSRHTSFQQVTSESMIPAVERSMRLSRCCHFACLWDTTPLKISIALLGISTMHLERSYKIAKHFWCFPSVIIWICNYWILTIDADLQVWCNWWSWASTFMNASIVFKCVSISYTNTKTTQIMRTVDMVGN